MKRVGYWVGGSEAAERRFEQVNLHLQGRYLGLDLLYLNPKVTTAESLMPILRDAVLIIADMTTDRDADGVLGVHPQPVLAATLGRFLLLVPTFAVCIGTGIQVPYDWRHFLESKVCEDLPHLKIWVADLFRMGRFPRPRPIHSPFPSYAPEIFSARSYPSGPFFSQVEKAATIAGTGIKAYEAPATADRTVLDTIIRRSEGAQAFVADFSTEDRSLHYPNASALTESVLVKWVFRKKIPLLLCAREDKVPRNSGWGEFPLVAYTDTWMTKPPDGSPGIPLDSAIAREIRKRERFPAFGDKLNALSAWLKSWAWYFWRPLRKYRWPSALLAIFFFIALWLWAHPDDPAAYPTATFKLAVLSSILSISCLLVSGFFAGAYRLWRRAHSFR